MSKKYIVQFPAPVLALFIAVFAGFSAVIGVKAHRAERRMELAPAASPASQPASLAAAPETQPVLWDGGRGELFRSFETQQQELLQLIRENGRLSLELQQQGFLADALLEALEYLARPRTLEDRYLLHCLQQRETIFPDRGFHAYLRRFREAAEERDRYGVNDANLWALDTARQRFGEFVWAELSLRAGGADARALGEFRQECQDRLAAQFPEHLRDCAPPLW